MIPDRHQSSFLSSSSFSLTYEGPSVKSESSEASVEELFEEDIWDVGTDASSADDDHEFITTRNQVNTQELSIPENATTSTPYSSFQDNSRQAGLLSLLVANSKDSTPDVQVESEKASDYLGGAAPLGIPNMPKPTDNSRILRRASAPMDVPIWNKTNERQLRVLNSKENGEEGSKEIMVPPHEIMAREYAQSVRFSVYEGVGRTLKGRDLSHVRAAILRKTGFINS